MPYRTATPASVTWGPWLVSTGAEFQPLPSELQEWDFDTACTLRGSVSVDEADLLESTGLGSVDDVVLVAQVDCPSTLLRKTASKRLIQGRHTMSIDVELLPGECAVHVSLSLHLVLGRETHSNDPTVATQTGSRLAASDEQRIGLGGDALRFPTEALAFSGILPAAAPWILNLTYDDLDDAFLGAARLLINTNHPAGRVALDSAHQNSTIIRSALKTDIVRLLIRQVAAQESLVFDQHREYEPNSVGYVVASLCKNDLKGNLNSITRLIMDDPAEFESRLQSGLGYLQYAEGSQ